MPNPPPQPPLPPGAQLPVKPPAAPQRPSIDVSDIRQTVNIGVVKQAARISSLAPKIPVAPKAAMVVKPVGLGVPKLPGGVMNPNMKVTQGKIKKETMRINLPPKPGAGAPMSALPMPKGGPVSSETAALGVTRPLGAPKVKPPSGPVQTQMVEGLASSKAPPMPKPVKPFFTAKPVAPTEKIKPASLNLAPKAAAPAGMSKQAGFQFDTGEAPTAIIPPGTLPAEEPAPQPAAAALAPKPTPSPVPVMKPMPALKPASIKPLIPVAPVAKPVGSVGPAVPKLPPKPVLGISPQTVPMAVEVRDTTEKTGPSGKTTSVPLPSVALKSSPDEVKARTSLLKPPPKIPAMVSMTGLKPPSGPIGSPQQPAGAPAAVPQSGTGPVMPSLGAMPPTQPLVKPKPPVPMVPSMGKAPPPAAEEAGGGLVVKRPTGSLAASPVPKAPVPMAPIAPKPMAPLATKQMPQMPKPMAAPAAPSSMPTMMTPPGAKPGAPAMAPGAPAAKAFKPSIGAKPPPQAPRPVSPQAPTTMLPDQSAPQPRPMPMMMAPASDGMSNTLALVAALCALAGLAVVLAGYFDML
jgi:collagen type IV alpha